MPLEVPREKPEVPKLKPGTIIERRSVVVDEDGVVWIIDPHSYQFLRADSFTS
jgi:hypothetical protein